MWVKTAGITDKVKKLSKIALGWGTSAAVVLL